MTNMVSFNFGVNPVRVLVDERGEPWWIAADVCAVLELNDTSKAIQGLDDDEKGTNTVPTPGGNQQVSIINEAGRYSLTIRSRKPEAKLFKRWITHEALPTIRKTGTVCR